MGNRVYLELRGSDLPSLAEDAEAVAALAANNSLPLFWLALLREEHLGGAWEAEVRAAFLDPDGGSIEPIRVAWQDARTNLAAACTLAEARLPGIAPRLRAWEAGILALAAGGPTREVRLLLAEHANFHDDADGFLARLREVVRLWHGPRPPGMPPFGDAAADLTGHGWLDDEPFPAVLPAWESGRPVPASVDGRGGMMERTRAPGAVAEWGMVLVFAVIVVGSALAGARSHGPGGMWVGGGLGFLVAVATVWLWARWSTSR